jgi:hypothetical protein
LEKAETKAKAEAKAEAKAPYGLLSVVRLRLRIITLNFKPET